jgi:RNA polymerase sigma factor (sigma-70 family)
MPELDDQQLLREFAETNSETAFAVLVGRYVNLVYSAARRFAGNPHHAEEITQAVFIILARKAGKLSPRVVLSGWLYQTARLTAANVVKGEIRRQRREQEAYMQSTLNGSEPAAWKQIAPLLDDAMGRLGETDRNAVVLHYFENKTAAEVAAALQLTEAAAHKRVNRALEKLRKFFSKRGVTLSATTIAGAVSANSVHAAPAGLAATITATAAKGTAISATITTLVKGTLKIMTYAKLKLALGIGAAVLLAGGAVTVALSDGVTNPSPPATRGQSATETNLIISSEFVEVPDSLLESLDIQWQPSDSGGTTAILTQQQHTDVIGKLERGRNVNVSSQPRIAFAPPMAKQSVQGTVSMTKSVTVAGTNAETGVILKVTASLASDSKSVNLILTPEWRELVDASPRHDGSQNTIRTTKATALATLTLNPDQTILIRQPVDGNSRILGGNAAAAKNLVVFVTPHLGRMVMRLQQKIMPAKPAH